MTQKLHYLESHIGSMEQGIELINLLGWNISTKDGADSTFVLAGDQPIFASDSQEQVTSFIYGMALAYSILPNEVIHKLRKEVNID
ncbi:MAG: hypothetical protein J0M33_12575 [Anaerolineae bacterium]|nr:hypothetical protein [Anaerolineae bacterium]